MWSHWRGQSLKGSHVTRTRRNQLAKAKGSVLRKNLNPNLKILMLQSHGNQSIGCEQCDRNLKVNSFFVSLTITNRLLYNGFESPTYIWRSCWKGNLQQEAFKETHLLFLCFPQKRPTVWAAKRTVGIRHFGFSRQHKTRQGGIARQVVRKTKEFLCLISQYHYVAYCCQNLE